MICVQNSERVQGAGRVSFDGGHLRCTEDTLSSQDPLRKRRRALLQ
jgi:hypothetical protein